MGIEGSTHFDITEDIVGLKSVLHRFYRDIGGEYSEADIRDRSYHPAIDRWNIERLWQEGDREKAKEYKSEILFSLRTNLLERYHVVESRGKFLVRNGEIYSEFFPKEPFSKIITRGVEYRKAMGSKEQEREEAELVGWLALEDYLNNKKTPIGSQVVLFSPPGEIEETVYTMHFVDILTKRQTGDDAWIERKRIAVPYTTEEYQSKIEELVPDYFANQRLSFDAHCLSHPIFLPPDFDLSLLTSEEGMSRQQFDALFHLPGAKIESFMHYYVGLLYEPKINWNNVVVSFNALLNHADDVVGNPQRYGKVHETPLSYQRVEFEEVMDLGRRPVKEVTGWGCPSNKGFSMRSSIFGNSVSQFGQQEESWEYHLGECQNCHGKPVEVGPCSICRECEKIL